MGPEQALKSQSSGGAWGRHAKTGWPAQQAQENHRQQQILIQSRERNSSVGYENGRCGGRAVNLAQSTAWPSSVQVQHPKQQPHRNEPPMRTVLLGGSGVKKECAGTGVFLPRRYGNPPESRKKTAGITVFCFNLLLWPFFWRQDWFLCLNLDFIFFKIKSCGLFIKQLLC